MFLWSLFELHFSNAHKNGDDGEIFNGYIPLPERVREKRISSLAGSLKAVIRT